MPRVVSLVRTIRDRRAGECGGGAPAAQDCQEGSGQGGRRRGSLHTRQGTHPGQTKTADCQFKPPIISSNRRLSIQTADYQFKPPITYQFNPPIIITSVSDPWHFETGTDPWHLYTGLWILLFLSESFKISTKDKFFSTFFCLLPVLSVGTFTSVFKLKPKVETKVFLNFFTCDGRTDRIRILKAQKLYPQVGFA
jgi:hypothetical protein